ncbi:MAG: hypothetical protein FJ137_18885 [Deltaproteobacteria bacterium]|nr:hypothetical protein [Deltaproteobacteria bacterium]
MSASRPLLRATTALGLAVALHLAALWVVVGSDLRTLFPRRPSEPVAVTLAEAAPAAAPIPPPALSATPPHEVERALPRAAPRAPTITPVPAAAVPAPMTAPATPTLPPSSTTTEAPSLLRLPSASLLDGALGIGAGGPGPSRDALTAALDVRVDGPVSDRAAAARAATRALQADLADDAVSVGLADDYFRTLRQRIEVAWRPAMKQLNDGGASTTQAGMLRSLVDDSGAWGELWVAYLDLAKQYANGQPPQLEPARRERLRELMRSRRGAFRVHAIAEAKLTQDAGGRLQLLELTLPSGHPGVDDGVREAIAQALVAMPEVPPARVSHGRSFSSWWRLRATWTMVPPTALLSGAAFDVTPKGFAVDVPFDIKLTTHVLLLRTDARTTAGGDPG